MKRFISLAAACAVAVMTAGSILPVHAADSTTVQDGSFVYTVYSDHAELTGCKPKEGDYFRLDMPGDIEKAPLTAVGELACDSAPGLFYVSVGKHVETVGMGAFYRCADLKTLTLPEGLKKIDESAFASCTALTEVTIPDSVTSLGSAVFADCTALSSVFIGSSVAYLPYESFHGCTSLRSVTVPANVGTIAAHAFENCTGLQTVVVEDPDCEIYDAADTLGGTAEGFTIYGLPDSTAQAYAEKYGYMFSTIDTGTCGDDLTWTLRDGVLTITGTGKMDSYASSGSAPWHDKRGEITRVELDTRLNSIGGYAFQGCTALTSVMLPQSVYEIGAGAFKDCSALESLMICHPVCTIYDSAPTICTGYDESKGGYYFNGTIYGRDESTARNYAEKYGYNFALLSGTCGDHVTWTFADGVLTISGTGEIEDYNIYTSPGWFSFQSMIKEAVIEEGVTRIGKFTFAECDSLTSITIPDSVTEIGYAAFIECHNLTTINIPDSVTLIDGLCFSECRNLLTITIPNSVTTFEGGVFRDCISLTSVTLPDSLTKIDNMTFMGCENLSSVIIPDSVTEIGTNAFSGMRSLNEITFPDSVTRIGDYAFDGCTSLTSVTIPDSVEVIENCAFYKCTGLTSAFIPASVTTIAAAFSECPNVTIYGYTGTTAEQYAKDNNIPFVDLDTYTPDDPTEPPVVEPTQPPVVEPTQAPTQAPTQTPTQSPTSGTAPAVTLWGDADGDGDCDIIDVIAVNKDQLGSAMLDEQGAVNADVNRSGSLEFADAVLIMKSLVDLVTLPV
ncbi:MAG: leucine-rich repeat protein [Oscillospiraceae bacterium]|nr:leucine-rich repeat protein [Oscillospiraceae bacterium]